MARLSQLAAMWREQLWPEALAMARSPTARDSAIVFAGHLLTAGLGFVAVLVVSRTLGPANFGLFSAAQAVILVVSGVTDLGLSITMVRFVARDLRMDEPRAHLTLQTATGVRLAMVVLIVLLSWPLAQATVRLGLGGQGSPAFACLALIGAAVTLLLNFQVAIFQAYQRFLRLSAWTVGMNVLKLALVAGLWWLSWLRAGSALVAYVLATTVAVLVAWIFLPRRFLRQSAVPGERRTILAALFSFSKWVTVNYVMAMLMSRVDVFMLAHFRGTAEVGLYSAAFQLATVFPLLAGALFTVLLPKVSQMQGIAQLQAFVRRMLVVSGIGLLLALPAVLFAGPLVHLLFSARYAASAGIFQVLCLNFMLTLVTQPLSTVLYATDRPDAMAAVASLQLALAVAGNWLLVPLYGGLGAAWVTVAVTFIGGALTIGLTWQQIHG
jgi:O-antigen/teichoic acid export membrane protein